MIEHIRKYSGLMIVVLVVIFISFLLMDTNSMQSMSGGKPVIKIDGRGYTDKEFRRGGSGAYEIIGGAMQSGDFGLYQAFFPLISRGPSSQEDAAEKLFVGRELLGQAKDEFGIHPNDEEISSYIRKMRMFAGPDGAFDGERYRNFVERGLGHLGMTEKDLRDIASDAIVSQKLQQILGSGLGADRGVVAANLALDNQQVTAELGKLDLDTFQSKIDPKEEEIKAFWEGIQDSFKTEPLRKFTYVLVTPTPVADAPDSTKESIADLTASDEAKAAAKKAEDEKKAAAAAKVAEERRKEQTKVDSLVDDFLYELEQKKGSGFEDLAKKNGWEVKTTELFPLSTPPADLNINLRASSQGTKAVNELFNIHTGGDAFSKISEAIPVGEGQWLVARLDGEEPSRVKTYAEARADARAQYISEKGLEALKAAAEAASTKIKESIAAGKSFADAAKEAGIAEVKTVANITRTYRPDAITEPRNLFEAVKSIDPGSLTAPIVESDRAFVVYVAKREVVKEPNAEARLDAEIKSQASGNQIAAFDSWLSARLEATKIESPFKK